MKIMWGLVVRGMWGATRPYKDGGLGGRSPPNIKKILNFSTKSTISKLKIAKIEKLNFSFDSALCSSFM